MSRAAYDRLRRARATWITWRGGACPVDPWTRVTVLQSDGRTVKGLAGRMSWVRDLDPSGFVEPDEIVAYRIRTPARVALCGRSAA